MKRFLFLALVFVGSVSAEDLHVPELKVHDILVDDLSEIECLAVTIYHEARGEAIKGQQYVAQTIMNRVRHKRWGDTVCEVVRQKNQFSFAFDGKPDSVDDRTAFILAYVISIHFFHLGASVPDDDALEYLYYVNPNKLRRMPSWSSGLKLKRVGNHVFMRS